MNALFGFALLVTLVPASLGAQTLAEAAKAEAARRATAAKATKVFRTKDLPAAPVPVTPPDSTATAVEAPLPGREAAQLREPEIVKAQQALQDARPATPHRRDHRTRHAAPGTTTRASDGGRSR